MIPTAIVSEYYTHTCVCLFALCSGCAGNEPLWKALGGDRLYSYYDFDDVSQEMFLLCNITKISPLFLRLSTAHLLE